MLLAGHQERYPACKKSYSNISLATAAAAAALGLVISFDTECRVSDHMLISEVKHTGSNFVI